MSRLLTKIELSVLHLHARKYSLETRLLSMLWSYEESPSDARADEIRQAYYAEWVGSA